MKNELTISVVIPVYNEEKYIERTLEALMRQTVEPEEIIVVDNNCKDRTIEIVKKFPEIRIVQEKEQGMSFARNRGFDEAKGDILLNLDADTILKSDFVESLKKVFEKREGIVGAVPHVVFREYIWRILFNWTWASYATWIFLGYKNFSGPSYALTKEGWNKIKGNVCNNDKIVHEDVEISMHLSNVGEIVYANKCKAVTSSRRITETPYQFHVEQRIRLLKQFWMNRGLLKRYKCFFGHLSPYTKD